LFIIWKPERIIIVVPSAFFDGLYPLVGQQNHTQRHTFRDWNCEPHALWSNEQRH
jgi:hypothetical protein